MSELKTKLNLSEDYYGGVDTMELPEGYNESALCELLEQAKADVEKEYGAVTITAYMREKFLSHAQKKKKNYNSQFAYEELKREIISFIKNGKKV